MDKVLEVLDRSLHPKFQMLSCCGDSNLDGEVTALCKNSVSTVLIQAVNSLLTLDIHQNSHVSAESALSESDIDRFRSAMYDCDWIVKPKIMEDKRLPSIKRGAEFSCYDVGVNGQILEYDFSEVVFNQNSKFQNIRIMKSKQYGNCLFLDNDMNLSESDLAYTVAITGSGQENFAGKDILVLGAGDGGILNYLVNNPNKPAMVTMVEIDQMVIDAAKVHLRGICGSIFDNENDDRFKLVVDDCIPLLKQFAAEKRQFDYIINDLTAVPVTSTAVGSDWDLLRLILDLSMDVLKPDGKYYAQGNATSCTDALAMYEKLIQELKDHSVAFSKENVCVPSYLEMWTFYKLWKTSSS